MIYLRFLFFVASLLLTQSVLADDPVKQLRQLIRPPDPESQVWITESTYTVPTPYTYRTRHSLAENGISFDVKKTDSLVTPYTGEIDVTIQHELLNPRNPQDRGELHFEKYFVKYSYQNGDWVRVAIFGDLPNGEVYKIDTSKPASQVIVKDLGRWLVR